MDAAEDSKVVLKLVGGVSFLLRCPSAKNSRLKREYLDFDFVGRSSQSKEIGRLFKSLGYVPREMFNAFQGNRRLIFNDLVNRRRADIFLDVFDMCHKFDLKGRLEIERYTVPLADMLATKLQIREINEKDLKDIISLFTDFDVGPGDKEMINGPYLAGLCADDWGVYKTFTTNLRGVEAALEGLDLDEVHKALVRGRVGSLSSGIESAPKSLRWRMRARVGEKVRWYELPEADVQVVDSRIAKEGTADGS